jgi:hypothetical protein
MSAKYDLLCDVAAIGGPHEGFIARMPQPSRRAAASAGVPPNFVHLPWVFSLSIAGAVEPVAGCQHFQAVSS